VIDRGYSFSCNKCWYFLWFLFNW